MFNSLLYGFIPWLFALCLKVTNNKVINTITAYFSLYKCTYTSCYVIVTKTFFVQLHQELVNPGHHVKENVKSVCLFVFVLIRTINILRWWGFLFLVPLSWIVIKRLQYKGINHDTISKISLFPHLLIFLHI